MRVFIQDRDVGQLDALERGLHRAGHEPVVIFSLTELLDMAGHPHLAPDAVIVEAAVISRSLRRLGEITASVLRDLLTERLLVATGPATEKLPPEVGARLPRPVPMDALEELLSRPLFGGDERRSSPRLACCHSAEVHMYNGGTYGPYTARFEDLSAGGARLRLPQRERIPADDPNATVDLWVHDGPLGATRLCGRLAWVSETPEINQPRFGVEFFQLTEAATTRIETALHG